MLDARFSGKIVLAIDVFTKFSLNCFDGAVWRETFPAPHWLDKLFFSLTTNM